MSNRMYLDDFISLDVLKKLPWTETHQGEVQLQGKFDCMQLGSRLVLHVGLSAWGKENPQTGEAILTISNTYKDTAANVMRSFGFNIEASPTTPTPRKEKPKFPKAES